MTFIIIFAFSSDSIRWYVGLLKTDEHFTEYVALRIRI